MTKITVELTQIQEKFLKEFFKKQAPGEKDNMVTTDPLHIVQSKRYVYVPYHHGIADYYEGETIVFCYDETHEYWTDDETEIIKMWYEDLEKECPIQIKAFSEVKRLDSIIGVDNEEHFITDYESYFQAYGVVITGIAWRLEEWENVAHFFILDEAKRYIEYQSHNLVEPRTYTVSPGYANKGDFVPFRDLLFAMGEALSHKDN